MTHPAAVPPLAEREKPGLSETLIGPKAPDRCQLCGAFDPAPRNDVERVLEEFGPVRLTRWIECDAWDRDTHVVVVLCERCSARLIDPHPRLYKPLAPDRPHPGCMRICLDCGHRDGVRCTHPRAKANGGEGVLLAFDRPPAVALVCARGRTGRSGRLVMYAPVKACRQKEPTPHPMEANVNA